MTEQLGSCQRIYVNSNRKTFCAKFDSNGGMQTEAQLEALEPLGSSVAGAIVCASLFFVGGIVAIANYIHTGRRLYS